MSHGIMDNDQPWFLYPFVAWQHQAIICTKADLHSIGSPWTIYFVQYKIINTKILTRKCHLLSGDSFVLV